MKAVTRGYFRTSDNYHVYYEDYQTAGTGTPIVMLHGFLCSSKFFHKNVEALAENHRVILVDWRGHGQSAKNTQNLTMNRCAMDLKELFDYLDLKNITLFTHSMSSSINCEYYKSFGPYRLKKMVICDSNLYPFSSGSWNTHQLKNCNMDRVSVLANYSKEEFFAYCDVFAEALFNKKISDETKTYFADEMKKMPYWMAWPLYCDFAINDYTSILPDITIPLLIIGANSKAIDGIACANYYSKLALNAEIHLFKKNGHMMFYEVPEEFNRLLLDFVEKN
ncbi:alpha/beta hydrolase [Megasphaera sp. An286]|uniref:alpha/beta fold hydrolase n=1 Tax=Megasphaera sp. An286 TaxID=1965622 RepID=UPI000B3BB24F|nr:alpha/beta hydrolase [Megasphaera sp. An286]OUO47928.1 hypothetical protein B5F80_02240 [Megasphaera sp. An286]